MIKAYQLLYLNSLSFTIKVNGVEKRVNFSGNSSEKGMFLTADENMQNALELHPSFGVKYERKPSGLYNKSGLKGPGKAVSGTVTSEKLVDAGIIPSTQEAAKADGSTSDSKEMKFANLQLARAYFSAEPYNIPKGEMMSYETINEKVKALGITLIFEK